MAEITDYLITTLLGNKLNLYLLISINHNYFNDCRAYFKLPKRKSFSEINPKLFEKQPELIKMLSSAYNDNIDDVDVYIGNVVL